MSGDRDALRRELEALGEAPPSEEELAYVAGDASPGPMEDIAVGVETVFALAHQPSGEALDELARRRARESAWSRRAVAAAAHRRGAVAVVGAVVAAAAIVLSFVARPSSEDDAELDALRQQAKLGLEVLERGVGRDTARAAALLDAYRGREGEGSR